MKTKFLCALAALAFGVDWCSAQVLPVPPEQAGLAPKTSTLFINLPSVLNNTSTESLGVAIGQNGNVLVGWEDDGSGLTDAEAVWTLLDSTGGFLTPETKQTSSLPEYADQSITNRFVSYFRPDGSATAGRTSWGPKIKANPFGSGFGMGATSFELGAEIPALAATQLDGQDFPSVQLISETGAPVAIVSGVSEAHAARDGNIRVGDWDYLSNGNVLIVGESRQGADLVDLYGGESAQNHAIYRIVTPAGVEVKGVSLVSETAVKSEIWHGAGVTTDGFAIRFAGTSSSIVRLFSNDGTPTSTNIVLADATGFPIAGGGGRGDGTGFHGNGKDAYVAVASGSDLDGNRQVWVTVINTNGTIRYSKGAFTDVTLTGPDRVDAAIYPDGRVLVVADDAGFTGARIVIGRFLKADGEPDGPTFYVSEIESVDAGMLNEARRPRVGWRNNVVAVAWESMNSPETNPDDGSPIRVVAVRIFGTFQPGSAEAAGLTRIVPDTPLIVPAGDTLGNWEPYASVLGNSTFLIEGNTFAQDSVTDQRYVVALQPAAGGTMKLVDGFYSDNGAPFAGRINLSRQNGNPGRVAGDKRPGAQNYVVGGEASPHGFPEFQSDSRWNLGFDRLGSEDGAGRYATVQAYSLNTSTLTPTLLHKALDSANGRLTSGTPPGNQISRFGGELAVLDNGNYVSLVEDRSKVWNPVDNQGPNAIVATIFAPDGTIVKDTWLITLGDIWSNLAAYRGGFAVRAVGNIYFFNNAGVQQGDPVAQATSGSSYDGGRGDGTRIFGHINSPFVYLVGKITSGPIVRVSVWDSRDRSFVASADVSEGGFSGNFDRANGASDALDRIAIGWVCQPAGYANQQVATRVLALDASAKTITPLTPSFFPFVNHDPGATIRSLQMTLAMTTRQILIAAKGEINTDNKPEEGANTPREVNFYTVLSHPAPQEDPTAPIGGGGPSLSAVKVGSDVTLSWPVSFSGFTLQSTPNLSVPITWTPVPGVANNSVTINGSTGNAFYRLIK